MPRHISRSLVLLLVGLASCAPSEGEAPADATDARASDSAGAARQPAAADSVADDRPVVVFFGTSLTAGLGLPTDDDTYVARAAELAEREGLPFRAVNAGVSGETSAAGARRIDWVLQDPLDVLVLELGANDGLRGLGPEQMRQNLTRIIRKTRERYPHATIVLAGMEAPPNLGPSYTAAFRSVFQDVATEEGALLVPFLLEGVAGEAGLNQSDGIHPTAEGHERMARNLWPVLRSALDAAEVSRQ